MEKIEWTLKGWRGIWKLIMEFDDDELISIDARLPGLTQILYMHIGAFERVSIANCVATCIELAHNVFDIDFPTEINRFFDQLERLVKLSELIDEKRE